MEKSLCDEYYDIIFKSPGDKKSVFVSFVREVFGLDKNENIYPVIGKLLKLYGQEILFFAILDATIMSDNIIDKKSLFQILNFFCKKIFKQKTEYNNVENLVDIVNKYNEILSGKSER